MDLAGKPKSAKKNKRSRKARAKAEPTKDIRLTAVDESEDDVISADGIVEDVQEAEVVVKQIGPFEGGFVHPAFSNAVSIYRKKSPELELLLDTLQLEMAVKGASFGSMYVKPSFIVKTGGYALL